MPLPPSSRTNISSCASIHILYCDVFSHSVSSLLLPAFHPCPAESLPDEKTLMMSSSKSTSSSNPQSHVITQEKRKTIVSSEQKKFGLVLQHPAFRANPLETLKEHLRNELALQQSAEEEAGKGFVGSNNNKGNKGKGAHSKSGSQQNKQQQQPSQQQQRQQNPRQTMMQRR